MNIIDLSSSAQNIGPTVVSVGNFDGVHRGHQQLIEQVNERARIRQAHSAIVTFEPHTRAFLHPGTPQPLLTTFEEKAHLIGSFGIEYLVKVNFDRHLAAMEPNRFIQEILIERIGATEWVMGSNHAFGRKREGNTKSLRQGGGRNDISTFIVDLRTQGTDIVSSTEIRNRLGTGNVEKATNLLGHPYLILTERVTGVQKGKQLGYPTLNFRLPMTEKVLPPRGVYAAVLEHEGASWTGALYLGNCPTFAAREVHFEFYAFSPDLDRFPNPGEVAALWVHDFLREDSAFSTEAQLVAQIENDIKTIHDFFKEE
jgi:riboflavin kinase/FMN adenylyltransferase